jgi:uncharacterized membrane protein YdbT with pleckstrin-like domain
MSDSTPDLLEQRIDAALRRMPQWVPPADFALRLAADAARQLGRPAVSRSLVQAGSLLMHVSDSILIVLSALTVAGVLTWVIPWSILIDSADVLVWTSIIVVGVSGLWMTRRTLDAH